MGLLGKYLAFDIKRNKKVIISFLFILTSIYIILNLISSIIATESLSHENLEIFKSQYLLPNSFSDFASIVESVTLILFTFIFVVIVVNQKINIQQDTSIYNIIQIPLARYIHIIIVYIQVLIFILTNYMLISFIAYIKSSYLMLSFDKYLIEYGLQEHYMVSKLHLLTYNLKVNPLFYDLKIGIVLVYWLLFIGIIILACILIQLNKQASTRKSIFILVALYFVTNIIASNYSYGMNDTGLSLIFAIFFLIANLYLSKKIEY